MTTQEIKSSFFENKQEELRVKALFTSQYLGHDFIITDELIKADHTELISDYGEVFSVWAVNKSGSVFDDNCEIDVPIEAITLQLMTVKMLTDEQITIIAKVVGIIPGHYTKDAVIKLYTDKASKYWHPIQRIIDGSHAMVQFGVITDFTFITKSGEVKTLTVEQILTLGWAKIKED